MTQRAILAGSVHGVVVHATSLVSGSLTIGNEMIIDGSLTSLKFYPASKFDSTVLHAFEYGMIFAPR